MLLVNKPVLTGTLVATVWVGSLVDIPHLVRMGPYSLGAVLTGLFALVGWFLWMKGHPRRMSRALRPYLWFLGWVGLSFLWLGHTPWGVQNVLVFLTFGGVALLAEKATVGVRIDRNRLGHAFAQATLLSCGLYACFMAIDGLGNDLVFHARTFAMFVLFGLGWFLAGWRYGSRLCLWVSVAIVVMIALSLSRMAFAVGAVMFALAFSAGRLRRHWKQITLTVVGFALALIVMLVSFELFRARFLPGGGLSNMDPEGAALYTSGRLPYWSLTVTSWQESPWVGHGPGTSAQVLNDVYFFVEHPHNDYLRVLHDYGAVGFALFVFALYRIAFALWKIWLRADRLALPGARFQFASFLGFLAFALCMVTDNALVYLFMMAPVAVLVGGAIGMARCQNKLLLERAR